MAAPSEKSILTQSPVHHSGVSEWTTPPHNGVGIHKRNAAEQNLWKWNLACCIAHGIQGVVVLILGLAGGNISKFKLPLTTLFLDWDPVLRYPIQRLVVRGQLPFVAVSSGFAFLSALAHLLVLIKFETYTTDLRKGLNRFRWYEYSLSSSLMIALIAMLFGVYDVLSLVLIMSINACMCLFGLLMETANQTTQSLDWMPFVFGSFAGAVPWAVILAAVIGTEARAQIPGFVWAILVCYFITFNTFPVNMVLQYRKSGWFADREWAGEGQGSRGGSGYYVGEKAYQVQSLVAKSLLLWLVVGGSNQPNAYTTSG